MYKMGKKEIVLDPNKAIIDINQNATYRVGHYKIKLFSSVEDAITEESCLKLSKVETKRIILPKYPVYRGEEYCGCAYDSVDNDWIDCFFGKGIYLRESIIDMKADIIKLSQMGYDLVKMPTVLSCGDFRKLVYYGTDRIQESNMTPQEIIQKNLGLFHEYLYNLVYYGMYEFKIAPNDIVYYLTQAKPITTTLETVLKQDGIAGDLILADIKKKVLR